MWIVLRFFRTRLSKLNALLLRNSRRLLVSSLLIGFTTGSIHCLLIRNPILMEHFQENLHTFPVEISLCALSILSVGFLLSYKLYRRHLAAKARLARSAIRQRYIDYIVLCLMVSVANSARRHLQSRGKEGLTMQQLEGYRRETECAIARFRSSARKLLHEPPFSRFSSVAYLERFFQLDDDRFGEEILALKRDTKSLMNVPAIKGLLDC